MDFLEAPSTQSRTGAAPPPLASSAGVAELLLAGHSVKVRVQGQSMAPSIRDGAVLTLAPANGATLRLGDVGYYRAAGGRFACHRLLARRRLPDAARLGFRGDAFTSALEWIPGGDVIGIVVEVDNRSITNPAWRWAGLTRAWRKWALARIGVSLGAGRRALSPSRTNPQGR
jgi:hypothetical protein